MPATITFKGNLNEIITHLVAAEQQGVLHVTKSIAKDISYYKLQAESFNGNGVWFNRNSVNRFSLPDHSKGVMYLAASPHTACNEFYQQDKFIAQSDFTTNCMAEIKVARSLKVFEETALAPHLGIAVGDLMGPKAIYSLTQQLATALAQHADGLEYLSRYTGNLCLVLWSDKKEGGGMVSSVAVTPLSQYSYQGKTAKEILSSQLNIRVV